MEKKISTCRFNANIFLKKNTQKSFKVDEKLF